VLGARIENLRSIGVIPRSSASQSPFPATISRIDVNSRSLPIPTPIPTSTPRVLHCLNHWLRTGEIDTNKSC